MKKPGLAGRVFFVWMPEMPLQPDAALHPAFRGHAAGPEALRDEAVLVGHGRRIVIRGNIARVAASAKAAAALAGAAPVEASASEAAVRHVGIAAHGDGPLLAACGQGAGGLGSQIGMADDYQLIGMGRGEGNQDAAVRVQQGDGIPTVVGALQGHNRGGLGGGSAEALQHAVG